LERRRRRYLLNGLTDKTGNVIHMIGTIIIFLCDALMVGAVAGGGAETPRRAKKEFRAASAEPRRIFRPERL